MTNQNALANQFESHRAHLTAVATRMLGSAAEAEDAVQETWLRLHRTSDTGIVNLAGWLTTVLSRICLDLLRARSTRAEDIAADEVDVPDSPDDGPEAIAMRTEATAEALAVVQDTLTPIDRVVFVLHDVFAIPFDDIASIVERTPAATRQIASRARRRVRDAASSTPAHGRDHRSVVEAFLTAAHAGDLRGLVAVLAPDVALRADDAAFQLGARTGWITTGLSGAETVARQFSGRAAGARLAMVDGLAAAVWAGGDTILAVIRFTVESGSIVAIDLIADAATIKDLAIETVQA